MNIYIYIYIYQILEDKGRGGVEYGSSIVQGGFESRASQATVEPQIRDVGGG